MLAWLNKTAAVRKLLTVWGIAALLVIVLPQGAMAHMSTVGYSDIQVADHAIDYKLYLDPAEVAQWVDSHSDGVFVLGGGSESKASGEKVGWTEKDLLPMVTRYLEVRNNGKTGTPKLTDISLQKRQGTSYLYMNLHYAFNDPVDTYTIRYNFFFDDLDPQHQNFATLHAGDAKTDIIFKAGNRTAEDRAAATAGHQVTTNLTVPAWVMTFTAYVRLGIEHIWTGYDHLLFIAALILLRQPMRNYVKIITAFTIGHSVTIAVAALDLVSIPPRIVEPLIALSIVYVAVENLWNKQLQWRWAVAFGFGLIHGFGFAQVLQGSLGDRYLLSLFSFNLGVELGQLTVLAVLLPLLILASRAARYRTAAYAVSGLIAAVGLVWFVERTVL